MSIRETEAKSILRRHQKIDSWFVSHYGMNLYRGCHHNCVYCDGRSENYRVEGRFGQDIAVKMNAIEILRRELDPGRKRVPLKRSFIMLGGGVGDSYQPLESRYELARKTLEVLYESGLPVHVLTKSTLIERDLDILKRINGRARAVVSFSFSSVDEEASSIFEPHVPLPGKRLEAIKSFKNEGIACGMFLLPVIPLITDRPELMEEAVKKASDAGVDFIISGGMTLKPGIQKDYFLEVLRRHYPGLAERYKDIYQESRWGEPVKEYAGPINTIFHRIAKKYRMPVRMPPDLFRDILGAEDLVVVILEHIDYLLKLEGVKSTYGYAAYSISQLRQPLSGMKGALRKIKGVNEKSENIILEILETGNSSYYQQLLTSG